MAVVTPGRCKNLRHDPVIPAQAGIQEPWDAAHPENMDSRFRGNDKREGSRDPRARQKTPRHDPVIPAQAGIQESWDATCPENMDSRFRGNDKREGSRDPRVMQKPIVTTLSSPRRQESRSRGMRRIPRTWIPAFAGMTSRRVVVTPGRCKNLSSRPCHSCAGGNPGAVGCGAS